MGLDGVLNPSVLCEIILFKVYCNSILFLLISALFNFYLSLEVRTSNNVKIIKRMSHSEELLNRARNIISSTFRQIENSSNVDHANLNFWIGQFDHIVRHLQRTVNINSPIADELVAILLSIKTISEALENSVSGNILSI